MALIEGFLDSMGGSCATRCISVAMCVRARQREATISKVVFLTTRHKAHFYECPFRATAVHERCCCWLPLIANVNTKNEEKKNKRTRLRKTANQFHFKCNFSFVANADHVTRIRHNDEFKKKKEKKTKKIHC